MSENNMELWKKVESTPDNIIKLIDAGNGKKLKSVPGINRVKKATELFGIYGNKWGLKELKHGIERIGNVYIATLDARFFVDTEDCKTEFEATTSASIVSKVNGEWEINTTYRKALETDLMNKSLSRLGFFADIYTDEDLIRTETAVNDLTEEDLINIGGED